MALAIARSSSRGAPVMRRHKPINRFLNRLPTITIREGHRVKIYVTSDLELPAYERDDHADGSRVAGPAPRRTP